MSKSTEDHHSLVLAALDLDRSPMATSERSEVSFSIMHDNPIHADVDIQRALDRDKARPTWHGKFQYITRLLPTTILSDNLGIKHTVTNPDTNAQRHRHLDLRMFTVRDYIRLKCARVVHIDNTYNCADMFTKPLTSVQFRQFRDLFMRLPARFRTSKSTLTKPPPTVVTPFASADATC